MINDLQNTKPSMNRWPFTLRFAGNRMFLDKVIETHAPLLKPGREVFTIEGHTYNDLIFFLARTSSFGFKKQKKISLVICDQFGDKMPVTVSRKPLTQTEYNWLINTGSGKSDVDVTTQERIHQYSDCTW